MKSFCKSTTINARISQRLIIAERVLKFGREVRTPAIQAGLTKRRMTLREIFSSTVVLLGWQKVRSVFAYLKSFVIVDDRRVQLAA